MKLPTREGHSSSDAPGVASPSQGGTPFTGWHALRLCEGRGERGDPRHQARPSKTQGRATLADPYPYDGLPSRSSITTTDWEVRVTTARRAVRSQADQIFEVMPPGTIRAMERC
jgi:hypothetical protein